VRVKSRDVSNILSLNGIPSYTYRQRSSVQNHHPLFSCKHQIVPRSSKKQAPKRRHAAVLAPAPMAFSSPALHVSRRRLAFVRQTARDKSLIIR